MNCKCALGSFCFSAKGQIANCPNRSIVASLATVCRRPFLATFFLEKRRNICARQTALSSNTVLHSSAKVVTQETSNFYSSLAHLINSVSSKKSKVSKGTNLKIVILVHVSQFYKRLHSTVQPFSVLAIAFATIRGNNRKRQDDIVALLLLSLLPFCTW